MLEAEYQEQPLQALRLAIDEEFFILSDAYYERYLSASQLA